MLDPETADEFLEISPLCGMAMEYGDIPRAGVIGGKRITGNSSHFRRQSHQQIIFILKNFNSKNLKNLISLRESDMDITYTGSE